MNIIRRRDPFETMGMGRLLRDFFEEPLLMNELGGLEGQAGTLPLDISEKEDEVVVRASLPGFAPDDIDVQVHNGMLMINAERTEEEEEQGERFHRRERRFGAVSRTVALPTEVREDQVRADLRDGVLTLHLPKTPEARPKKIPISGGDGGRSRQTLQTGQQGQQGQKSRTPQRPSSDGG